MFHDHKRNILIYLSTCEQIHYLPLLNLGIDLEKSGCEVSFLICSHGPCPGCYNIFNEITDFHCVYNRAHLLKDVYEKQISPLFLSDFFPKNASAELFLKDDELAEEFTNVTWGGYDLGNVIRGTVFRYLQRTIVQAGDQPVINHLLNTAVRHIKAFEKICDTLAPDMVILFNGMTYPDHAARLVAQNRGIAVVAEENSCFADRKFLEPSGVVLNRQRFAEKKMWDQIRDKALSPHQKEQLESYLSGVFLGKSNTVAQCRPESPAAVRERLGLEKDRPLALLLGQVPFDSVIAYDSPLYSHLIEFIRNVINFFAQRPDWGLVVRLHPLEASLFGNSTFHALAGTLPENIRLVQGLEFNTYDLMDCCRFGMTINSQSGLEMLAKHKPVLVAGNAFYGGKGFSNDLGSREQLGEALEDLMANPEMTVLQREWTDRFLHAFIFDFLVTFNRQGNRFGPEALKLIDGCLEGREAPRVSQPAKAPSVHAPWKEVQNHYLNSLSLRESGRLLEALEALENGLGILAAHGREVEGGRLFRDRIHILQELVDRKGIAAELCRLELLIDAGGGFFPTELLIQVAGLSWQEGRWRALDRCLDLLDGRDDSNISEFFADLANQSFHAGHWETLGRCLDLLNARAPEHPAWRPLQFELALMMAYRGRWEDAEGRLSRLHQRHPEDLEYLFHWVRARRRLNKGCRNSFSSEEIARRLAVVRPSHYAGTILKAAAAGNLVDVGKRLAVLSWYVSRKLRSMFRWLS